MRAKGVGRGADAPSGGGRGGEGGGERSRWRSGGGELKSWSGRGEYTQNALCEQDCAQENPTRGRATKLDSSPPQGSLEKGQTVIEKRAPIH